MKFIFTAFADNYIQIVTLIAGFFFVQYDHILPKKIKHMVALILFMIALSTTFEYIDLLSSQGKYMPLIREISTFAGYVIKPGIFMVVNIFIFGKAKKILLPIALQVLNILVCCTIFFSPIVCSFNIENEFIRGPLGYFPHIIGGILLICFISSTFVIFRNSDKATQNLLLFIVIVLFFATVVDTISSRHVLNIAMGISAMLYYLYTYMQKMYELKQLQDEELRLQRDELMTSQIQPHFIYNTLNTIYYLCYDNAEKAAEVVVKFSEYLRNNLELGRSADKLISISREIETTKIYSEIEMLRFDEISVEYDIQDDGFDVPALCIQPMVENAIRHGVKGIKEGLVLVQTYRTENDHVIVIKDNGIGYVRTTPQLGKSNHIGVQNVRDRIVRMCGGTFDIEMIRDKGTTVTLTMPIRKREES